MPLLSMPAQANAVPLLAGCVEASCAYRSDSMRLVRWRCVHDGAALQGERHHDWPTITLSFAGLSEIRVAGRVEMVDPATGTALRAREPYSTRHPWGCRCRGWHIALAPAVAADVAEAASALRGEPVRAWTSDLPLMLLRVTAAQSARCRLLAQRFPGAAPADPEVEEEILALAVDLIARSGALVASQEARSLARHRELVRRTRMVLNTRLAESLTLPEIARAVYSSPARICAAFRLVTGTSIHRYRCTLRLLAAVERVGAGEDDLAALAFELGFSSHSHLTAVFHRELGVTPSALRRASAGAAV